MERNQIPRKPKSAESVLPLESATVILSVPTARSSTKRKAEEALENDNPIKKAHLDLCSAPSIPTSYVDRIRKRGSIKKPLLFRLLNKLQDEQMAKANLPVLCTSFPSNDTIVSFREEAFAVDCELKTFIFFFDFSRIRSDQSLIEFSVSPRVQRKTHGNNLGNKPYVRRPKKVISPDEVETDP